MATSHTLGAAGLALGLATSAVWAEEGRGRFDGAWRVEFRGNPACYAPRDTGRWTIKNGAVLTARGTGTVNANGRVDIKWPGAYFGRTNVIVAILKGNKGTGSVEVEGTQCRYTIELNRMSH